MMYFYIIVLSFYLTLRLIALLVNCKTISRLCDIIIANNFNQVCGKSIELILLLGGEGVYGMQQCPRANRAQSSLTLRMTYDHGQLTPHPTNVERPIQ